MLEINRAFAIGLHVRWRPVAPFFKFTLSGWQGSKWPLPPFARRVPLYWAWTFGDEGVALTLLAERWRDAAMAETALSQINTAFEAMRDGGNASSAAYYERQLPRARAIVVRLRGR
jgi:hypothetical protein